MTVDLLKAADTVQAASAGEPAALCRVYGHDEYGGWFDRERDAMIDGPLAELRDERGEDRPGSGIPRGVTAATACKRCGRVWR